MSDTVLQRQQPGPSAALTWSAVVVDGLRQPARRA